MFDKYERGTFFYTVIGPYRFPVFQPGTVTLFSAVQKKCPLEVFSKGCGQNGPILGMSCALFLAKFSANLSFLYKKGLREKNGNVEVFESEIFDICLKEVLEKFSGEDADHHGRLIEIKEMLFELDDRVLELNEEEELNFFLNDYRVYQKLGDKEKENFNQYRKKMRFFQNWEKLYYEHDAIKIQTEILPLIKNEILNKRGIFADISHYELLENQFEMISKEIEPFEKIEDIDDNEDINYKQNALNFLRYGSMNKSFRSHREAVALRKKFNKEEEIDDKFIVKNNIYHYDFNFNENYKLAEYYDQVKRCLRTIFVHGKFYKPELINKKKDSLKDFVKYFLKAFPRINDLYNEHSVNVFDLKEKEIKENLELITSISSTCVNLVESLSVALTITRRNYLYSLTSIGEDERHYYGNSIINELKSHQFSDHQIIGFLDSKFIEFILFLFSLKCVTEKHHQVNY